MAESQPPGIEQGVIPMLSYRNGVEAMNWLANVFGFIERVRWLGEDGALSHGEMETGSGIIMLATPSPAYEGPKMHRVNCERAKRWAEVPWVIDGVLVHVDDLDAHYRRSKAAGAVILGDLEIDGPEPRYRAEDLEGHRWMFMQIPR
jgi:uncharacterized glyoxalase superfamily protein PhnB